MARFLVVHKASYEHLGTMDRMIDIAKQVRDSAPEACHWLNSWWDAEDELLFCDWEAPDEHVLRSALEKFLYYWSIEKIYPVLWSNPEWYE